MSLSTGRTLEQLRVYVPHEYNPQSWNVVTRYACPYSCDMCFFGKDRSSGHTISDELIDKFLDGAISRQIDGQFLITGGEPMLDPAQVFRTIRKAKSGGLKVGLGSTYLGNTIDDIENNAEKLKEAGLDSFWTSLDASHCNSHPKGIQMDYRDYQAAIHSAINKRGIQLYIRVTYEPNTGSLTTDLGKAVIMKRLHEEVIRPDPLLPEGNYIVPKGASTIHINMGRVIEVGDARRNGLSYSSTGDVDYSCPAMDTSSPSYGMITLHPDGNVARCCNVESGADFGFGNLNDTSIEEILHNMESSVLFNPLFPYRLKAAHRIMQQEFPHLLPKDGVKEGRKKESRKENRKNC